MKTEQAATGTPLIELRDIYKIYHMGDTEVHASDGVSLKICKHRCTRGTNEIK